jgi:hypothetical protein
MPETRSPGDVRPVKSAVLTCQETKHYFDVVVAPAPFLTPPPSWWPVRDITAYGGEPAQVTLAGVNPPQRLDGAGRMRFDDVPSGHGTIWLYGFCSAVREALEESVNLPFAVGRVGSQRR